MPVHHYKVVVGIMNFDMMVVVLVVVLVVKLVAVPQQFLPV